MVLHVLSLGSLKNMHMDVGNGMRSLSEAVINLLNHKVAFSNKSEISLAGYQNQLRWLLET